MRFGIFYEHQLPRPWDEDAEYQLIQDALEQVELADKLRHRVRLGGRAPLPRGVLALVARPRCSSPRRASARRTSGSATGSSRPRRSTTTRRAPPSASRRSTSCRAAASSSARASRRRRARWAASTSTSLEKRDQWQRRARDARALPDRDAVQRRRRQVGEDAAAQRRAEAAAAPHPPLWVACSRRDTIMLRGRAGPRRAHLRVHRSRGGARLGRGVREAPRRSARRSASASNREVACVTPMMVHKDEREAIRRGLEGGNFFGYSLAFYIAFGDHVAGRDRPVAGLPDEARARRATTRRSRSPSAQELGAKVAQGENSALRGAVGTPDQLRELPAPLRGGRRRPAHLRAAGRQEPARAHHGSDRALRHARSCPSSRSATRSSATQKAQRLRPLVDAALARRKQRNAPRMPADYNVPAVMKQLVQGRGRRRAAREDRRGVRGRRRQLPQPGPARGAAVGVSCGSADSLEVEDLRVRRLAEQLDGAVLVDVADEPAVQPVAGELAQARREAAGDRRAGCRAAGSPAGAPSRRSSSWRCRRARRRSGSRRRRARGCRARRARCRGASRPGSTGARSRTPDSRSRGCEPGMMRVAPFSSVKSVSAHIELHTVGDVRLRRAAAPGRRRGSAARPRRDGSRSTRATTPGTRDRARRRRSAARAGGPGSPRSAARARAGCTRAW